MLNENVVKVSFILTKLQQQKLELLDAIEKKQVILEGARKTKHFGKN